MTSKFAGLDCIQDHNLIKNYNVKIDITESINIVTLSRNRKRWTLLKFE